MGGAEFAVGVSFDPAFGFGVADVFGVPLIFGDVGEAVGVVERHGFGGIGGFDDYFGDFGAVDAVVGAEGVFAVVALDDAAAVEAFDCLVIVVTFGVGEGSVGRLHGSCTERKDKREKRKEN